MASGSVSVRLPEDVLAKLAHRANAENKKVSDVVRELIETGLTVQGKAESSTVLERIDKLEGRLIAYLSKSVQGGAEARYFARLASMYGIDVAHYVAQKTELGVVPKPPDKDEKARELAFFERKCKEYVEFVLSEIEKKEPG